MNKVNKTRDEIAELESPEGETVGDLLAQILEKQNEIIDWINRQ